MGRRFITKQDIDAAADAGTSVLELGGRVTVTDLAREHARERGVRLVEGAGTGQSPPTTAGGPLAAPAEAPEPATLHAQVRAAVIARLGAAPDGLDAVIARVLDAR
ncbi:MAG: hypothetical protein R6T85_04880 [Egibacteraceae bacterium]